MDLFDIHRHNRELKDRKIYTYDGKKQEPNVDSK